MLWPLAALAVLAVIGAGTSTRTARFWHEERSGRFVRLPQSLCAFGVERPARGRRL